MTDNNGHDEGHDAYESNEQRRRYDDAYIRKIAKEGAREGAREVMDEWAKQRGIDPEDWHEVQKDHAYLRRLRTGSQKASEWVYRSMIVTVVTGIAYAVWQAIRAGK